MRPTKSRSRGKTRSSNNRSPANNLNRVFDSSGPEGKVRGTPQQIIDKYSQLARDASLGNDRVAAVNFQQHAEHYTRLLAEAQRDAEEKRLQAEQQNRDRQQQQKPRDRDDRGRDEGDDRGRDEGNPQGDVNDASADVIDSGEEADSGLVETPEAKPRRAPRSRKPRSAPKSDGNEAQGSGESARGDATEAAE